MSKKYYEKFICSNAVIYYCYEAALINGGGVDMSVYRKKELELIKKEFNRMAERIKELEQELNLYGETLNG